MKDRAETEIGIRINHETSGPSDICWKGKKDWLKVDHSAHFTVTEWHDESHGEAVLRRLGEGGPR